MVLSYGAVTCVYEICCYMKSGFDFFSSIVDVWQLLRTQRLSTSHRHTINTPSSCALFVFNIHPTQTRYFEEMNNNIVNNTRKKWSNWYKTQRNLWLLARKQERNTLKTSTRELRSYWRIVFFFATILLLNQKAAWYLRNELEIFIAWYSWMRSGTE